MGVPLFFKQVIKGHFPSAVLQRRPRCTTLAIDFAGIEHAALAEVAEKFPQWTLQHYLHILGSLIINLVKNAGVQKRLIICRDGMPPIGKMIHQRSRRFRKSKEMMEQEGEKEWTPPFDSNALSPGTEISIKIDEYLSSFLSKNLGSLLPPIVIFSGYRVPGEGEHKIIEHIQQILNEEPERLKNLMNEMRRVQSLHSGEESVDIFQVLKLSNWESLPRETLARRIDLGKKLLPPGFYARFRDIFSTNESILIYGLDADLIFLTLPIDGNLFLWRYNTFINQKRYEMSLKRHGNEARARREARIIDNVYLSLKTLKDLLRAEDIGVPEFIMGGFIFGNDFLPTLPAFNIVSDVSEHYVKNLVGRRFAEPFNLEAFQDYLRSFEPLLPHLYDRLTGRIEVEDEGRKVHYLSRLDRDNFEKEWRERMLFQKLIPSDKTFIRYNEEFIFPSASDELHEHAINFFKTILWAYRYYKMHKSVSWEWAYYNYWAPPIEDLLKVRSEEIDLNHLNFRLPNFNLAAQLLLILPRDPKTGEPNKWVPKKLQIFQKDFSPIFDFYPIRFSIYLDGAMRAYNGFPFLPYFDYLRFYDVMSKVEFSSGDNVLYGQTSVRKFETTVISASLVEQIDDYDEEERDILLKPNELIRFDDLWKKKATEIFGPSILAQVVPPGERLFSKLNKIDFVREIDIPNLEIKRKIL